MKSKYQAVTDLPLSLNASEVAGFFGISLTNAYCLLNSQGFPAIRLGKKRMIVPRDKLLEWIDAQTSQN